jgi:hypothetical protein
LVISARVLIASSVWDCARERMSHGGFAIQLDPVTRRNLKNYRQRTSRSCLLSGLPGRYSTFA